MISDTSPATLFDTHPLPALAAVETVLILSNPKAESLAETQELLVGTPPQLLEGVGYVAFFSGSAVHTLYRLGSEELHSDGLDAEYIEGIEAYLGIAAPFSYRKLDPMGPVGPIKSSAEQPTLKLGSFQQTTLNSLYEAQTLAELQSPTAASTMAALTSPAVVNALVQLEQAGLPVPENEYERLRALYELDILDTAPEHEFDLLAQMASHVCGTPFGAIALMDSTRHWIKAQTGQLPPETKRKDSFSQYLLVLPPETVLVVEDATQDRRFRNLPPVVGPPYARFYAGVPLSTAEGLHIGTIFVCDTQPRSLTPDQRQRLALLGREAMMLLTIRKSRLELQAQNRELAQQVSELSSAKNHLFELYKELDDSIRYAQRIQEAVLPKTYILERHFPHHFLINRPKHRLTGDFFWAFTKRSSCAIAVADCTGHGVPGALLTMLGNNLLNRVQRDYSQLPLELWLAELDQIMLATLGQGYVDENSQQDGMEIGLVNVDFKARAITYAGAGRNLYLFRQGEVSEYKGMKLPIGGTQHGAKEYHRHDIPFEYGDRIYLFSDGPCDLFGGPKLKRLGTRGWLDMLKAVQHLPMEAQGAQLEADLLKWMGALEQPDDILVLGAEIMQPE